MEAQPYDATATLPTIEASSHGNGYDMRIAWYWGDVQYHADRRLSLPCLLSRKIGTSRWALRSPRHYPLGKDLILSPPIVCLCV